ncbi:MAG: pilus assembly protein TadE [Gammaproteobacteria bacterium]|nr:pilus assembly protein TadE [Gammaproteobacteria bacterium]
MGNERWRGAGLVATDLGGVVSHTVSPAGKRVLAMSSFRGLGNARSEEQRADYPEDRATQEAVRAGTLHGASLGAIRDGLARGLTPLYTHGRDMTALGKGYAAAWAVARQADIRILNPTQEAFADFAEQTRDPQGQWIKAIPVDHLGYRPTSLGSGSGLNIQDATLLKIQVTYVQPLIVPFIDQIGRGIYQIQQGLGFFGIPLRPVVGADGQTRWGIPMQAEALMRMQSPVLSDALPQRASLEQPQDGPDAGSPGDGDLQPMPTPGQTLPTMPDSEALPPDHICNAGTENRPAP